MPFLSVENLVVRYGNVGVLHGVSVHAEKGSLTALLGSSGCGKTTLLRAVAGFNAVAGGRVALNGQDITGLPPERRNTAMVFQSYALWPHMTVAQNLAYGLRLRKRPRSEITARTDQLLQLLHLPGLGDRNVAHLSGGQRQRVALGRALAVNPDVLLLDEPLSNLDASIRLELRHEIRAIQQRVGITALHVTHDREEAMVIADRIVVLREGVVAQEGTPEEVYHRPNSPFVAGFMGADNVVRVDGEPAPDGMVLRTVPGEAACLMPLGKGGMHLAGPATAGPFDAHFRAAAARLLPADTPAPAASLLLPGRVCQSSYPGDVWRYTVEAGGYRYLIDDPARLAPGDAVRISIPAAALHLFPATTENSSSEQEDGALQQASPIKRRTALAAALLAAIASLPGPARADTTLNVATAGDQNMVDYVNEYLGPKFEKAHPGVRVRAVGTGPGDAGSLAIQQKLSAEDKSGAAAWDIDVAVIHQRGAAQMVQENLLAKYRDQASTSGLVTSAKATNALGTDVGGYVLPMFDSQVAIAYNPAVVKQPPRSFAEIAEWSKQHPKQFGYNGIKGGMAGIGFVMGWVEAFGGIGDRLVKGPYEEADKVKIDAALTSLRAFNQTATLTPGNAGTLDMLNRGEISAGAVWADMFYSWQNDGRLSPDLKLILPSPGLPGQPMYYAIPRKAAQADLARQFIELATSPEVQAEGIVQRFNWYPGIDAQHVQAKLDAKTWNKLFVDITPQDLKANARPFPISPYFSAILSEYERIVMN